MSYQFIRNIYDSRMKEAIYDKLIICLVLAALRRPDITEITYCGRA